MFLPPRRSGRSPAAATFTVSTLVEVCLNDPGFQGAWFEATVTKPLPMSHSYTVVFATLVSDENPSQPLRETVRCPNICTRPPSFAADDRYASDELVDVYHNDGWWLAINCIAHGSDPPSLYSVCFPVRREETQYGPSQMRPHLEWKDGHWCPSSLVGARFEVGEEVEVDGDRDNSEPYGIAWLTGIVAKMIDKSTFFVEYSKSIEDVHKICQWRSLILDISVRCLRGCPRAGCLHYSKRLKCVVVAGGWVEWFQSSLVVRITLSS